MNVTVFGLGKLGSPMAAVFADAGHIVMGCDVNERVVAAINDGVAPVREPQLQELLTANHGRISATTDGYAAALFAEAIFIVVPTPSMDDGLFDNKYVVQCMEPIGRAIQETDHFKWVVVVSTVVPRGTVSSMEAEILPALLATGAEPDRFSLLYNPEFIALGSVIHDMWYPDLTLIGGEPSAYQWLTDFWRPITKTHNVPAHCMSWINAELAKLCLNCAVTTKLSLANMIGNLCEEFNGGDSEKVLAAIGADSRIGSKYFRAATAYGGPCFVRDVRALCRVAANIGQPHDLALATEATNTYQISRLAQQVAALLYGLPDGVPHTVGVLGLAYKPETDVVEESAGIDLVEVLDDAGIDVLALDPWANEAASLCVSSAVRLTESLEECVSNSAVVVITTPWSEFHDIKLSWLERDDYRPAVIDCWGMFGPRVFDAVADYHATGKGD